MPRTAAVRRQRPVTTFRLGPFGGVNDTVDDGEARPTILQDLTNGYIPDPQRGSDVYERPGCTCTIAGLTSSTAKVQGFHEHVGTDGTVSRFLACGGSLYRVASDLTTTTLLSPGVTIDTSARVYFVSYGDTVIVNDGVHRPWILSSPASTATGAYIDIDGAGSAWVAQGAPVVYGAKVFFIVASIAAGAYAGTYGNMLAWSEEATPATGYRQSGYDNQWELTQTSTRPIYALAPTNVALYYFRESQIGAIAGTVNADFRTTATHDAVSLTVGTTLPATVVLADSNIFFADPEGRVWLLPVGGTPQPIWQQMRAAIQLTETLFTSGPTLVSSLATTACASLCPDLRVVVFALWEADVVTSSPPDTLFVFDARTGTYCGRWLLSSTTTGYTEGASAAAYVDALGVMHGSSGGPRLMIGGTSGHGGWPASVTRGAVWHQGLRAEGATAGDTYTGVITGGEQRRAFGFVTPPIASGDIYELQASEVAMDGVCEADAASAAAVAGIALSLVYTTPYGYSSGLSATPKYATSLPAGQSFNNALSRWRAAWGLASCVGRWARFSIALITSGGSVGSEPVLSLGSVEVLAARAGRAVTK